MEGNDHGGVGNHDAGVSFIDIKLYSDHYWSEIMKKLKRGIIFLDKDIYRVLHFNGGIHRLYEEGKILGLREFSSFNYGSEKDKKGIFILSSPLLGLTKDILKEIISGSSFEYIQVITTVSPSIHCPEDSENSVISGTDIFKEIEEDILNWMGNFDFTCEIFHYPLHLAPLSKELFLTPAFDGLFPLHFDFNLKEFECKEEVNEGVFLWSKLSKETKLSVRRFASFWVSFLGMYNVKPDIFTVGALSSLIADRVNLLLSNKGRSQTNPPPVLENKVSLMFLDRSADLFTISKENRDKTALNSILENLIPYPGTKEDVCVDMSELFNSTNSSICPPGCLADNSTPGLFDALLLSTSECQEVLSKKLRKVSRKTNREKEESRLANDFLSAVRKMSFDDKSVDDVGNEFKMGFEESVKENNQIICDIQGDVEVKKEGLEDLLASFKLCNEEISSNLELLQKGVALKNATAKYSTTRRNIIQRLQGRILKDLSSKYPENVFESLIQMVKDEAELSLRDIFQLLIFAYSRCPVESIGKDPEAEDELESLISDRLLNEGLSDLITMKDDVDHRPLDELLAHKIVKKFFTKCIRLNANTSPVLRKANFSRPYLELFLQDIYSDGHEDIPQLVYKSRGTLGGRLIKSGLSFLGLSVKDKKIHPRENPIIIIFLVGGISPEEIRRIRDVLKSKKAQAQFIIGSNVLLHSKSLLDHFFLDDAH